MILTTVQRQRQNHSFESFMVATTSVIDSYELSDSPDDDVSPIDITKYRHLCLEYHLSNKAYHRVRNYTCVICVTRSDYPLGAFNLLHILVGVRVTKSVVL